MIYRSAPIFDVEFWSWTTPNPPLKETPIFDGEYVSNGTYLGSQWITRPTHRTGVILNDIERLTLSDLTKFLVHEANGHFLRPTILIR